MDHQQWHFRLPPPANNICPICYISHFPFCPPPPPPPPPYANQNPRFPPHPGFDPRPWHGVNPNFEGPNPVPPVYDYYGGTNGFVSEYDRNYNNKRMRIDENNYQSPDHERRLKLIHDHGCASGNPEFFNRNGVYSAENHAANNSVHVNHDWQSYGPNNQPPPTALPLPPLPPPHHGWQHQNYCNGNEHLNTPGGYLSHHTGNGIGQPPLPTSPPPPLPVDPPLPHLPQPPPPPKTSLFPVPLSRPSSYPPISHASAEFLREESRSLSMPYLGESQSFPLKQLSPEKPKVVNALQLFKQPHRATRPDHIVIILRGLPGSGKSYLAKMLRDLEVENGGDAPRIHSMDDYFMTEVEKVGTIEEGDVSKSSSSIRSKKPITKKVMEYCYEPEMEEVGDITLFKNAVDDRNLRVADFAQFWAFAKRSGYEVYILEATYKDPAGEKFFSLDNGKYVNNLVKFQGCAARNVHGFTFDAIEKMAGQWEEAPSLYLQLDIKSLFHGDDLKKSGIKEVDMDLEDEDIDEGLSAQQEILEQHYSCWGSTTFWEGKSVRWGDQVGDTGFSIGAAKNANMLSLVIGPGAGYNLKSNPLTKEGAIRIQCVVLARSEKQSSFQEHLRAEHESFKAVFDRRRTADWWTRFGRRKDNGTKAREVFCFPKGIGSDIFVILLGVI
ncbi:hypothetical protein Patl1_17845 [Pistacia atlantica]|uniref:Uncharacterized protein n=1 Tax=Pistacia atlantica TaxID=434234 RepID=A0ACC1BZC7_9ROSI|nr:hypothetical protein Patl1_17845 [Pistacia atlantica]